VDGHSQLEPVEEGASPHVDRQASRGVRPRAVLLRLPDEDREVELGVPQIAGIDVEDELIWITIGLEPQQVAAAAATVGEPPERLMRLMWRNDRPTFRDDGELSAVSVRVPLIEQHGQTLLVVCAFGRGWVITAQDTLSNALSMFRAHVRTSGWLGALDSASFAGLLLDWLFNQYRLSFEQLEEAVDAFDSAVLERSVGDQDRAVSSLVGLRRRVTALRRMLAAHRDLELWISHASEHYLVSAEAMEHLERIGPRIEQAFQAADTARDSINGSFALLMSTTAQRTNDIIKLLTVVSVTLLPATLVAGIMGMNFHPTFFDRAGLFWAVVAVITSLISAALLYARRERWI
jgi:Mg2+ and Co2+ transporter CorA